MKLTTERLKKLIREEFQRLNESDSMSGQTKDGKEFEIRTYKAGNEEKGRLRFGRDQNYSIDPSKMGDIASTLESNDMKKALSDLNLGRARPDKDFVNYVS